MLPLQLTKSSQHQHAPAEYQLNCRSRDYTPSLIKSRQQSPAALTAPATAPVHHLPPPHIAFKSTIPSSSSTSKQGEDITLLLSSLQKLSSSLAEAARVKDLKRMQLVLQMLHDTPVTGQLLLRSQAAVTVRRLLRQQQADLITGQAVDVQLLEEVVQIAEQLLYRWKAGLAAETAAAHNERIARAREVCLCYTAFTQPAAMAACSS